jgi:adenylate cyclase
MREIMRAGVIGLATGGFGIMLALTPEGVSLEERFGLSWLFALRGPIEAPADVMLVTLDRRSAEQMALPEKIRDWPRSLYASLIERLADNGASAIALDLILERAREPEHDVALMRAIDRAERVILFEALDLQREPTLNRSGAPVGLVETQRVRPPLETLTAAAAGLGPFPLPIVPDRVSQAWLFQPGAGGRPTLPAVTLQRHALEAYADWLSLLRRVGAAGVEDLPVRREDLRTALEIRRMMTQLRQAFTNDLTLGQRLREGLAEIEIGLEKRRLLNAMIGLYDGRDSRYLNFYGPAGQLRALSLVDVITAGPSDDPSWAKRAVFVGQSERYEPHNDAFITVYSSDNGVKISGVEIAATAFANLLDGSMLEPSRHWLIVIGLFGLAIGVAAALLPRSSPCPAASRSPAPISLPPGPPSARAPSGCRLPPRSSPSCRSACSPASFIRDSPFAFRPITTPLAKVPIKRCCARSVCRMVDAEDAKPATGCPARQEAWIWRALATPLPSPATRPVGVVVIMVMPAPLRLAAHAGR